MATIKKIKPETSIQIAYVDWFHWQYPQYKKCPIKISNENSFRGYSEQMGMISGASDLIFPIAKGHWHGLFIEIKKDKYKVTKSNKPHFDRQMEFINIMISYGYYAKMCIGLNECINETKKYMDLS